MMKQFVVLMILLSAVLSCGQAVYTTVTATLVDSSSQIWANATVIASLRPSPNNPAVPLNNGLTITDSPQTVTTDSSGTFTLILDRTSSITPAGALWTFNIYPNASVKNSSSINLAITGTTLNLSGILSSILIVPSVNASPVINRAYSNTEVIGGNGAVYWDVTANALKGCIIVVNGLCTTWTTIGNFGVPGSHYFIPYNNGGGAFTASSNLQFNDITNTFSTFNLLVANNTILSGTLNVVSDTTLQGNVNINNVGSTLNVAGASSLNGGGNLTGTFSGTPNFSIINFTTGIQLGGSFGVNGQCLQSTGLGTIFGLCNSLGGTPTLAAKSAAGVGATVAAFPIVKDRGGELNLITGSGTTTSGDLFWVTFSSPFSTAAFCTVSMGSNTVPLTVNATTTSMLVGVSGTALSTTSSYTFYYLCSGL